MDSAILRWNGRLEAPCVHCSNPIIFSSQTKLWNHAFSEHLHDCPGGPFKQLRTTWPQPHKAEYTMYSVRTLGYEMGKDKISIVDNPFCSGGPLYCTLDTLSSLDTITSFVSLAYADAWDKGWHSAQVGEILPKDETQLDGFDYLASERG